MNINFDINDEFDEVDIIFDDTCTLKATLVDDKVKFFGFSKIDDAELASSLERVCKTLLNTYN